MAAAVAAAVAVSLTTLPILRPTMCQVIYIYIYIYYSRANRCTDIYRRKGVCVCSIVSNHAIYLFLCMGVNSQYLYCVWTYKILLILICVCVCVSMSMSMYKKNCMRWITRLVDRWRVQPTVWINVNRRLLWTSIPWTHIAAIGLPVATSVWASAYKLSLRVISSGLGECRNCSSN